MKDDFGSVKIFGHTYEKDIIVHHEGRVTKRKKKKSREFKPVYGHTPLSEKELDFLKEEKPEVVYIGIGYQSALPITERAQKILKNYKTILMPTPDIAAKVEQEKKKFVAIIHVTC